jgi:hypothetical protein
MAMSGVQWRGRKEDLLVLLATGLFAAGLCFVPPTVFESGDYVLYCKPTYQFLADTVRAGGIPLWNPYIGLGRPFLADMQNNVFYPPMYLICAGQAVGVFLLVWLHCLLAVLGMRRLGGALAAGRWQSYLMGFTFLASGALTARWMTGQLPYCWGLCFVPWLLYYALRTEEPWQIRRLAQHAACLALQFLCGHPQVFWFSAVGQAVFILTRALRLPLRESLRDALRSLAQLGVACVWCAGLVAVALLPMLELAKESNRSATTAAFANSYNLAWTDFRYLFVPLWSGAVWESHLFVGTLVVVAGVMGLCRVRERNVRGLLGLLLIALLIALGDRTPFFGLFYKWLPGYAGFRFQSRAALLALVAVICAAGIWLSRPHPRLRAVWTYLFGVPVRYGLVLFVLLQSLDLLQCAWIIKRVVTPSCCFTLGAPLEDSFEQTLVAELRKADLLQPFLPPPRVCVPPSNVPADYGMIHHYSHFDAACSLFVRRPWDYLHAMLGILPPIEKGSLSTEVYSYAPFPYRDLSLSIGMEPQSGLLVLARDPAPRAFVVYGAEVADYGAVLKRLAHNHVLGRSALLETPLAKPLPPTSALAGTPASIRRFEPNELLVDVEARTNALLVLAEAWYPGWRAEIDGRAGACLPANIWMRAVPVPAGRHLVRVYFRQNYLLPGLLISLASAGLWLVAVAKPRRPTPPPLREREAADLPAAPRAGGKRRLKQPAPPLTRDAGASSANRPLLRALATGAALAFVWLLARVEVWQVRRFQSTSSGVDALAHCQMGGALLRQHQTAQAQAHFTEAVRLGERACELTRYREPLQLGNLACAYAATGNYDKAFAIAKRGRDVALATSQDKMAGSLLKLMEYYEAQKAVRAGGRK